MQTNTSSSNLNPNKNTIEYRESTVKKALYRQQVMDPWFSIRYAINPYSGCEYSCSYCRVNWKKPKVVITKTNIIEKVGYELSDFNVPQLVGVGGGYNDIFAPINKEKRISEELIIKLMTAGHKPLIMTKNPMYILNFKDTWLSFPESVRPIIVTSVTKEFSSTSSFNTKKDYEIEGSNTPSIEERLSALRDLASNFCTGVFILPIIWDEFNTNKETKVADDDQFEQEQIKYVLNKFISYILNKLRGKNTFNILNEVKEEEQNSSNTFLIWGEFKGAKLNNSSLHFKSPFANLKSSTAKQKWAKITELYYSSVERMGLHKWVPFEQVRNFISKKDAITVLLLRYYYLGKFTGKEKNAFRLAAYNINKLSEKEFLDLFVKQELETISGVGEVIAKVISRYLQSGNIDFFSKISI